MYNFVFWFFYRFFEWRKGFQSSFLASAIVGLVILAHLGLIYSTVRYFSGFRVRSFSDNYLHNRLLLMPLMIVYFLILYFAYYKKRADKILAKRKEMKFSEPKNIALAVVVLVVPMIVAIELANAAAKIYDN